MKLLRFSAVFLCFALLLCAIPQTILAQMVNINDSTRLTNNEKTSPEEESLYVIGEVIEDRTLTTKTFRMSDGTYFAADYGRAIHFADENGNWVDYDNRFTDMLATDDEISTGYENTKSDLSIKLANNSNSLNLLKITYKSYKISLGIPDADKSKAIEIYPSVSTEGDDIISASTLDRFSAGAIYENILPNTDLEYIISGNSLKENIIVKEKCEKYLYNFELKLDGLVPEIVNDGSISLLDEMTKESVMSIPAGYMYDAKGCASGKVYYNIEKKNGKKYLLTITADSDWINAEERAFPVVIDPSVEAFTSPTTTIDTYINENAPNTTRDDTVQQMVTGYTAADPSKEFHVLIKSLTMPELPKSSAIISAKFRVAHLATYGNGATITAKQIISDWDSSTATWNTKPNYDTYALDYVTLNSSTVNKYVTFDVTSVAQKWYNGTATNYGIALCPTSGNGTGHVYLGSSDINTGAQPSLLVHYRDTKGLESHWTFSSHSVGANGNGHINGFNGNLVYINNDISTKGSILPITVSHVYNGYLSNIDFTPNEKNVNAPITADYSAMKVGKGFKLSIQETLVAKTINDIFNTSTTWYVYSDSDGTELYFYYDEDQGKYISEDGYGLYITTSGTQKLMTDDFGNTKTFDASGRLIKIEDAHGNKKNINYTSGRISSITYTPANASSITQLTFTYNTGGYLTKITDGYDTSNYVSFAYSNGYLTSVTYSKGGSSSYTYNSDGTLATVTDGDTGYTVSYNYKTADKNKRIAKITESVGITKGRTVSYTYRNKFFAEQSSNTPNLYNISLFDNFGRAFCSYAANSLNSETVYAAAYAKFNAMQKGSKKNNTIAYDASKDNTGYNYLINGSFENTTGWSLTEDDGNTTATYVTSEKYVGAKALKLTSTASTSTVAYSASVSLNAGTYTLSAYVKTTNVSGEGVIIALNGVESASVSGTTNTNIDNGWQRISVNATIPSAGTYYVDIMLTEATGTAYIDGVQLESGADVLSEFNLIENSGFSQTANWSGLVYSTDSSQNSVGKLTGSIGSQKRAYQTITVNAPATTSYMLSGWAKGNSVYISNEGDNAEANTNKQIRSFGMMAKLTYSDGTTEEHKVSFDYAYTDWQYAALAVVPQKQNSGITVNTITVYLLYDYNMHTAVFDNIALTVEPGQIYSYDDNGNIKVSTDALGNSTAMDYINGVDLQNYDAPNGEEYDYTYNDAHQVTTAKKTAGSITQTLTYNYDIYGNTTSAVLTATGSTQQFGTTLQYGEYGNYITKITDSLGNSTNYNYNSTTKLLNYVENANSVRTAYFYDNRQRIDSVYIDLDKDNVQDGTEPAVMYLYSQNRLSNIETDTTEYNITYDVFGKMISVQAGDKTIAQYTYAPNNGHLEKLTYGNGDYEEYEYDNLDRLVKVYYNGSTEAAYSITYDANNNIRRLYDGTTTHVYDYDSLGRLIRAWQYDQDGNLSLAVQNSYDFLGRANGTDYAIGEDSFSYNIEYKADSNLVSSIQMPFGLDVNYSYDAFDRVTQKTQYISPMNTISSLYNYKTNSNLLDSCYVRVNNSTRAFFQYTYDAVGNILTVSNLGFVQLTCEYDSQNQLVYVANQSEGYTYLYRYDNGGNLTTRYKFNYTTEGYSALINNTASALSVVNFGYSSSLWGDQLTSINGIAISYDGAGNPTNWHNARQLNWENKRLTRFYKLNGQPFFFNYNSEGIRTYKMNGGMYYHNYILDGTRILRETVTGDRNYILDYFYDDAGNVLGFEYDNNTYYYLKNIQGDVLGIYDYTGTCLVSYTYDAWGRVLSVTGTHANTLGIYNPFRYRSYYYDEGTELYYLNSRYYDPAVGRFLSPDAILGVNGGITGYNLYAYCNNNPIIHVDFTGYCTIRIEENGYLYIEDINCGYNFLKNEYYQKSHIVDLGPCPEYQAFMEHIKSWEGFGGNAAPDLEGDTSIGYGHKIYEDDPALKLVCGTTSVSSITPFQARLLLWVDICTNVERVKRHLSNYPNLALSLTTSQFLSLVDMSYNGCSKLKTVVIPGLSSMSDYTYDGILNLFVSTIPSNSNYYNGLYNRRKAECDMFCYGFGGLL